MRTRRTAAAASLLLLLPLASAAGVLPLATVVVKELQTDAGTLDATLAGASWVVGGGQLGTAVENKDTDAAVALAKRLAGQASNKSYLLQAVQAGQPIPIRVPAFTVEAGQARVTVYSEENFLLASDASPPLSTIKDAASLRSPPEPLHLSNLRINEAGVGDRDSARILVLPMEKTPEPQVHAEGPVRANSTLPPADSMASRVPGQPFRMNLSQAMSVPVLQGQQMRITGSFLLVLDALDVNYTSGDGGAGRIETRREVPENLSASFETTTVAAHDVQHEAIIELWDATLTLPADGSFRAFVRGGTLAAQAIQFDAMSGQILGKNERGRVQAFGDLQATLEARDGRDAEKAIGVRLDGELSRLLIEFRSVPVPQTAAVGTVGASFPWLALALLAVPAIPAAQWAAARHRFTKMDRALDRGDFRSALRLAGRFTPWPGQRQDGVLAAAICLLGLGRPAEASQRLEGRRWSAGRRPMRDFLRARAHAALGHTDEATRALAASLLAEPSLIAQARTDPVLAGLLEDVRKGAPTTQEAYA